MAETDKNNIDNQWILDIFKDAEREAAIKYRGLKALGQTSEQVLDAIVPNEADYEFLLLHLLDGCTEIASKCAMVQAASQTPLDAINYTKEADFDLDADVSLGRDDFTEHEKMRPRRGYELIVFAIPGLEDAEQTKFSVMQQYIRSALRSYLLWKWYNTIGLKNEGAEYESSYEDFLMKLRNNPITNKKVLDMTRPSQHYLE